MKHRIALALSVLVLVGTTAGYADDVADTATYEYNLQRAKAALPKVVVPSIDEAAPPSTEPISFNVAFVPTDGLGIDVSPTGKKLDAIFEETDRLIDASRKLETAITALYREGKTDSARAGQIQNDFNDTQRRIHMNLEKIRVMMATDALASADTSLDDGAASVLGAMRNFQFQCANRKQAASEVCVTTVRTMNQMTAARADMMRSLYRAKFVADDGKEQTLIPGERRIASKDKAPKR